MQTWFIIDMPLCNILICLLLLFLSRKGGIITRRVKAFCKLLAVAIFATITSVFYLQYDFGSLALSYNVVYILDIAYNFLYAQLSLTFL